MRAAFIALAPLALGWFAMEVKWFLERRKQRIDEERERDRRGRIT